MSKYKSERGAALIMVAFSLMLLMSFLALTVDIGVGYAERRKMQNAADAAALAGALALGKTPNDTGPVLTAINEYAVVQNGAASYIAKWMVDRAPGPLITAGGPPPAGTTGIQVTAIGSAPTFFAGLLGINQMTAAAIAGGEFRPVDVVILYNTSNNTDDDACDFRPYFGRLGEGCSGVDLNINSASCLACKGAWSTAVGQVGCHWKTATGPLMTSTPAKCAALGVGTSATCNACGGAWTTLSPVQPGGHAVDAARTFIDLNNPAVTNFAVVGYYGYNANIEKATQTLISNYPLVKSKITVQTKGQFPYIASGMQWALAELQSVRARPGSSRFILLFTDGLTTLKATLDPACSGCLGASCCPSAMAAVNAVAAQACPDLNSPLCIHISVVGVGSVFDTSVYQAITNATGGTFTNAGTSAVPYSELVRIRDWMVKDYKVGLTQ